MLSHLRAIVITASLGALTFGPVESAKAGAPRDAVPDEPQPVTSDKTEVGPVFLLSLGGKLYDDLWSILDTKPPEGRNPPLKDVDSIASADTWRCVTCHGWDYSGAEIGGKTFPSLRAFAGAEPDAVRSRLRDPAHPFPADALSDTALEVLALFITAGQYDRSEFVSETGQALGNPEFGQDIFEGACISCHQLDGRMFLRGDKGRATLGSVARERPTQALHRILNGVPAAEMLSLRFLSEVQIADLLAYLQTLDGDN